MKDILSQLCSGTLSPLEEPVEDSRYRDASALCDAAVLALAERLDPECRRLLEQLSRAHQEALSALERDAFIQGFRTGGKLALALLG